MKWLFLVHHMKRLASRERVKVWRLTKKVGAVYYRNSVYVLPYGKERLEDFQWLCEQINASKGEASVFISEAKDEREDKTLRSLFEESREEDYGTLLESAQSLLQRIRSSRTNGKLSTMALKRISKEAKRLVVGLSEVGKIDFFSIPTGQKAHRKLELVTKELSSCELQKEAVQPVKRHDKHSFQQKIWATRENIHIDRVCSAWLIKRFIDPKAKFVFAPESALPKNALPFDVFGAEFSHHGEDCTFEALLKAFEIKDKTLKIISEIVHDVDVKDNKFGRPESFGLDAVIRGLSDFLNDDHKMLQYGSTLLDALYAYLSNRKKHPGIRRKVRP